MRFGFFLREALRSLRRNAVPSFAAMATVLVTVLVLGVFIPVVQATTGAANEVRAKVLVDVYLKPDATKADIARVEEQHRDDTPGVGRVEFISKEQALEAGAQAQPGEAYDLLGSNPLPDTFRVTPDDARRHRRRCATRSRRWRRPGSARWSTRRSTRSRTARRRRTRSSPPRAS